MVNLDRLSKSIISISGLFKLSVGVEMGYSKDIISISKYKDRHYGFLNGFVKVGISFPQDNVNIKLDVIDVHEMVIRINQSVMELKPLFKKCSTGEYIIEESAMFVEVCKDSNGNSICVKPEVFADGLTCGFRLYPNTMSMGGITLSITRLKAILNTISACDFDNHAIGLLSLIS